MKKSPSLVLNEMESLRTHISMLVNLPETEAPIISAYIDLLESKDYLRSKLAHWAAAARTAQPSDQRSEFDAARMDVQEAIHGKWPDEVRSIAIFSRSGTNPFLLVIPFSVSLDLHFTASSLPAIFPLVQLKDRFHRFVVVIATEEISRIFEVTLGAISEEILTKRPELSGRLGREWGREHFNQKKRENDRRYTSDQVTIIVNLMAKRGINHLILAGSARNVAALREALPKHIGSRLVGEILKSPVKGDSSLVLEEAIDKFIEAESAESRDTVTRLNEQIMRGALGVVGVEQSRDAIIGGYAAQLVISEELHQVDREELTRLAAARQLDIEVCEGDELLAAHGGVGCLLRYRPPYLPAQIETS
ncbi:MAG: hypothetical protein H8M99_14695 [Gloeobacteraceae cyanobacterium ES-bin-144]|nr:hypothetical protein [Verrucomicrobiales bacterium]